MKRHLFILTYIALSICDIHAQAQKYIDALIENPYRAASNYQSYEFSESELSHAPKGYKPFYISHYSRHGSRYHTGETYFRLCLPYMAMAEELDLLSEEGKAWYNDAQTVLQEHQGMFGMLTSLGSKEQDAIGKRIYERFQHVFSGKNGRTEIRNRSTRVQRSIVSMASFNTAIAQMAPSLDFIYAAGDKFRTYLNAEHEDYSVIDRFDDEVEYSLKHLINTERVLEVLFKDSGKVHEIIDDTYSFVKGIFLVSSISPNTDSHPDMLQYFHQDDIIGHWIIKNNTFYAAYGNSTEMAQQVATIARPLIKDIIEKADEALEDSSRIAADFRFGHDTGLLPLVATLGIKGMEETWSAYEAHEHWSSSEFIPMASNLQIIFYKNRKDKILVKMLYNEKETSIPAIVPECGPYYSWPVLRDYLKSLL